MRIVADPNVPYVEHAFAQFGEVELKPSRRLTRDDLADCEILLVRSTINVDAELLDGTSVGFVGTSTSGFDHVDTAYLKQRNIPFAYAPGSNAASVAEYVTAALLTTQTDLANKSIGIVGCGHVGREVLRCARALGLRCIVNDPPLARSTAEPIYRPLDEVFACDILTLHVPLTYTRPNPTHRLVDARFLSQMKPNATFINTARGEVIDSAALIDAVDRDRLAACILDVWEHEPYVDPELARRCTLGTAHIAGHSFDGKVAGTQMLYEAYCAHVRTAPTWNPEPLLPAPDVPEAVVDPHDDNALQHVVRQVYDIMVDAHAFDEILALSEQERGAAFDELRKNYRKRRSFARTRVRLTTPDDKFGATLQGLGFQVESASR